ncbi:MAG: hypothetical protein KAT65_23785 [Methanophagales archaeon]|nr:hypothetical protein [Methanophagales archaeon]
MKNFASEHLEAITAIIVAVATSVGVAWMIFSTRAQRKHEKEMEKLRQDYDEKIRQQPILAANNQIISCLEDFVLRWEEKENSGDNAKTRKQMTEIGNELKIVVKEVEKNLMLFPLGNLKKTKAIADEIISFSKRQGVITVGSDSFENLIGQQRKKRVEEGNTLVERVKDLIVELQQEGEEEKGVKEDE